MEVIQHYKSKKNKVYKININGDLFIVKHYKDQTNIEKEYALLKYLNNYSLNTPIAHNCQNLKMYMDYIEGVTLLDYFIELENNNVSDYKLFLEQFSKYHKNLYGVLNKYQQNMILNDMNFRNYIIKNNQLFRIDYESCSLGSIESDVGKLAAFALTYAPAFTHWKKVFADYLITHFCSTLSIAKEKVIQEMEKELTAIKIRRK